jgi:virginiamycin B lyase
MATMGVCLNSWKRYGWTMWACALLLAVGAGLAVPGVVQARAPVRTFSWFSDGVPPKAGELPLPCCSSPTALVLGADGHVLAGEDEGIGELDPLGRMRLQPRLGEGRRPTGLLYGPSGELWELLPKEVVRIAPGGIAERHRLEGVQGGMAAGPGRALWVTTDAEGFGGFGSSNGPEVVEIVPGGLTQVFPLSDRVERLGQIVVGSDGNLWLAEQGFPRPGEPIATRIARLTPTGQLTSWIVDSGGMTIHGLAASSGGVWFTLGNQEVGRIGYHGQISSFSRGIPDGAFPDGITKGPDGAMWFTELGADAIGRIDARGHVKQFPWAGRLVVYGSAEANGSAEAEGHPFLPGGADAIVSAPGDTLWFSRPGTDELGRLSLSSHCSVPDLVGHRVSSLRGLLGAAGCRLGRVSGHGGASVVVRQGAPAGSLLAYHAAVGVERDSARTARGACVPDPGQRVVIADRRVAVLAELEPAVVQSEATLFDYRLCRVGGNGPSPGRPIEEYAGGGETTGTRPERFALAGDFLAWENQNTTYGSHWTAITVLDTRTGRSWNTGDLSGRETFDGASSVAIDTAGHLAWRIARTDSGGRPVHVEEMQAFTPKGVVTLEAGTSGSFGPPSFTSVGALRWTYGGQPHSYTFPE